MWARVHLRYPLLFPAVACRSCLITSSKIREQGLTIFCIMSIERRKKMRLDPFLFQFRKKWRHVSFFCLFFPALISFMAVQKMAFWCQKNREIRLFCTIIGQIVGSNCGQCGRRRCDLSHFLLCVRLFLHASESMYMCVCLRTGIFTTSSMMEMIQQKKNVGGQKENPWSLLAYEQNYGCEKKSFVRLIKLFFPIVRRTMNI